MLKFSKAEMLENGTIQLREEEVLELADGTEYKTGKFHRVVYTPDTDISTIECDKCKALATALWTEEVIQDYKDSITIEEV